jgi:hypothetical protein
MIDQARRPLRILMTNNTLAGRAGSELYVRDLALEFMKRGHLPVAYSPSLGEVAEELRAHTIPVLDDLDDMEAAPDLIHGHHHHETMTAALRYPRTPIVFVCHGWVPWEEMPPIHPNIVKYVAVDDLCRERLLTTRGIAPEKTATIYNFADLDRFILRPDLPSRPKAALAFSNYIAQVPDPIRAACGEAGIELIDICGTASGRPSATPEAILGKYDIVFAKARSAIEALACGCAVIVADAHDFGGMVTTGNLEGFRRLNFGVRSMMSEAVTQSSVAREIARYDAQDARSVSETMRTVASLKTAVDSWLDLYEGVIADWNGEGHTPNDIERMRAGARYLRQIALPLKTRWEAQRELISLHARLDEMSAASARRQAGVDTQRQEFEAELERRSSALSASRATIDSQRERHQRDVAKLSAVKADLAAVRHSRAWRLIQRIRKLRQWLTRR